jgi:YbgC/YbaW family acyl-CoA thioester hydrolase
MWGDLDALGIVFYPRYYEWIDAGGHLFFEAIGLGLDKLWHEHNILFGLAKTTCRYFKPGRYHQRIRILTRIHELTPKTVSLKHDIESASDHVLMVEGLEKRICLDVSDPLKFRAIDIPADINQILAKAHTQ